MAIVKLDNVVKRYPDKSGVEVTAVRDIDLEIKDREFMVLVGPSGCGKSTTLRMIAGLEEISGGTVSIDGQVVNDVLPKDRDIAMVFQNYALYPHMTVYENMAFGLKMRKFPTKDIDARVREAAAMLGLEAYLERKPKALSGGQRQRVAVGRAIVRKPKVFLFDEPLSNLDAKMRVSTRTEIARLHDRLEATMIYVTHDQTEAMTMGDRICVMKDGRIVQVAEPLTLYNEPANTFVAGFIGSPPMNFISGTLRSCDGGWAFEELGAPRGALSVKLDARLHEVAKTHRDRRIILGVRPEDIHDSPPSPGANWSPALTAIVELVEPMGAETFLHCTTGAHPFIARIAPESDYEPGDRVQLRLNLDRVHLFENETGERLVPGRG
jgi:multiple sugar transport system ATP-binding protein